MNEVKLTKKAVKTMERFVEKERPTAIRTGRRDLTRRLINRNKVYSLSDYVRKLKNEKSIISTPGQVVSTLKRMGADYTLVKGERGAIYVVGSCK